MDQQVSPGGNWILLGTHNFVSGTTGYVELTDNAGGSYVIADAVRFVSVSTPTSTPTPTPTRRQPQRQPAPGDFSGFNPTDIGEYVIEAGGIASHPFSIGINWIERVSYQNAVDFMMDSRCYVGTHNSCTNGVSWRDQVSYAFSIPTLIAQYLSNPSAYERMPSQVSYIAGYGTLDPPAANAPDIVKLIHWGVDRFHNTNANHTFFKEHLAAFLYAYPDLKPYITQNMYQTILDFTFPMWGDTDRSRYHWNWDVTAHTADLFQVYTQVGTGKGEFPPGHSIVPNLMMYEVALREGRSDSQNYFDAAYNQIQWIIDNPDWTDPTVTKGHMTLNANQWYTLKLELAGSSLKGYVDGVLKIDITDTTFSSGKIGFPIYDASVSHDDVLVTQ